MCGRYVRARGRREYAEALSIAAEDLNNDPSPIWNMPPGVRSMVYGRTKDRDPTFGSIWWGLVPTWAKRQDQRTLECTIGDRRSFALVQGIAAPAPLSDPC